jgi:hypothetical protein
LERKLDSSVALFSAITAAEIIFMFDIEARDLFINNERWMNITSILTIGIIEPDYPLDACRLGGYRMGHDEQKPLCQS